MNSALELNKEQILQIFVNNFNLPIIETPLGQGVRMTSRDAFIFCNVTGSGYLNSLVFPFTPKGLMKLFYNAFDYKFVTGIFDKTSLRYTPLYLSIAYPFLFDSEYKTVVPVEFDSEIELQTFLKSKKKMLEKQSDYIVMRIEKSKQGNGLESFMEYLAGEYFKRNGFIVENQIPLAHSIGSPDFGGYELPGISAAIKEFLPNGFHIIELSMLRLFKDKPEYDSKRNYPNQLIVGEAKTSTTQMDTQLKKYLNTGLFDWGFEIHPFKQEATDNDRGMFTLDGDMKIKFIPPAKPYKIPAGIKVLPKKIYHQWLENYMKFYLIANMTNDEFACFYSAETGQNIGSQEDLADFVIGLSPQSILNHLKSFI